MRGSGSGWQCILIPWQYWGSTRTHAPITLKLWGGDITAASVIPVSCAALPRSALHSTSLLLFTFLPISFFPWAWLSIPLAGIEEDNFLDRYCVITVISVNCFSTGTWCWQDAQRAPGSTASGTPAGGLLLTQMYVRAQACTHTLYSAASLLLAF